MKLAGKPPAVGHSVFMERLARVGPQHLCPGRGEWEHAQEAVRNGGAVGQAVSTGAPTVGSRGGRPGTHAARRAAVERARSLAATAPLKTEVEKGAVVRSQARTAATLSLFYRGVGGGWTDRQKEQESDVGRQEGLEPQFP